MKSLALRTIIVLLISPMAFAKFDYSPCAYTPKINSDDPEATFNALPMLESYYIKTFKKYFLAVDQCQKNAVTAFGGTIKKKPKSKTYVNSYQNQEVEFPDGQDTYSSILNVRAYASSGQSGSVLRNLDFTSIAPTQSEGMITDDFFAKKLLVCQKRTSSTDFTLVPCASVQWIY